MKYLFFDIECSNCFNGIGKMCEFGYVVTDEHFHVIKSGDIPMSPGQGHGNRFHLTGRKHEKDLILAYDYDFYYTQPEFLYFYEQIRKLVEDPDTICFAYSMDNDIPHLYNSCKRYNKKPFNYTCYDVQQLVSAYLEIKGQMSLKKACINIVGPNSVVRLQEHLSRDDAEMERLIFEAICVLTKKESNEILEASQFASTNSIEYMDKIIEAGKKKTVKTKGYDLYKSQLIDESELDNPEYIGKRYNISVQLKLDLDKLKNAIEIIKQKGGIFVNNLCKTDIFIVYDDKNKEELMKGIKSPFEGIFLTYQELVKDSNL